MRKINPIDINVVQIDLRKLYDLLSIDKLPGNETSISIENHPQRKCHTIHYNTAQGTGRREQLVTFVTIYNA